MNCQQGDLAIVVKSAAGNEGKIVRCIRLATPTELDIWRHDDSQGPVWVIDRLMPRVLLGSGQSMDAAPLMKDRYLRPIRDTDAPDEMTLIAPLNREDATC